jgi:drug/metabolite transporter (DMT)-like permease
MFYALGAAIANIIATTTNKQLLSREKMNVSAFSAWIFIFLFLLSGILLPSLGFINLEYAFSVYYLFLFLVMILLASVWNYFFYNCLEKDSLVDFQVISVVQPLLTIALSMIVFSEERSEKIIIASIISGIALYLSHQSRWRIENFKVTIPLFFAILLAAIESLYHKELLAVYSPVTLYFVRTGFLALIFTIAGIREITHIKSIQLWKTIYIAIFAVATMILSFYGYQTVGIAQTQIIMLLYPIGATILSYYLFKEHIQKRKIIALAVIILCVIYTFHS